MVEYILGGIRDQTLEQGAAPYHVCRLPDGTRWIEFHRIEKGYLLRFPDLAEFEVSADGCQIWGVPAPGISDDTVEHLYLNQALPFALSKKGKLVLHACAMDVNGSAITLMGETGRGKSTLAAAFAMSGCHFLSDDSVVIETLCSRFLAMPSHPSIRLWEDSERHLLNSGAAMAPSISYTSKGRFLAGMSLPHCDEPKPLIAAYVLGPGQAATVEFKNSAGLKVSWPGHSTHFCWIMRIAHRLRHTLRPFPAWPIIFPVSRSTIRGSSSISRKFSTPSRVT